MVARVGIFATISREPRQARKGATVTVMSGAEEAPARAATHLIDAGGARFIASDSISQSQDFANSHGGRDKSRPYGCTSSPASCKVRRSK